MNKRAIIGLLGLSIALAAMFGLAWNGRGAESAAVATAPAQAALVTRANIGASQPAGAGDRALTIADLAPIGAAQALAAQGPAEPAVEQPPLELTREQARSRLLAPLEKRPASEQRQVLERSLSVAQEALESTRGSLAALEERKAAGEDVTQLIGLVEGSVLERERSVHELEARLANFGDTAAVVPTER